MRLCADEPRDLGADPLRRFDPAALVPASNEAFAPFMLHDFACACGRGRRQRAERMAIEVNGIRRQGEPAAQLAERIVAIHLSNVGEF